jgi:hypothetical protein
LAKEELIVELTLGDNIPVASLWPLGFHLALQFIVAINMATSGFWWWPLAPNRQRFYEKIDDLEKNLGVQIDDASFNVFTHRPKLTDVHMQHLTLCLAALPGPNDQHRAPAYTYYLGGLNFIALNSIQWRCEGQAFGNFLESLRLLMAEAKYLTDGESLDVAVGRLLKEKYPDLDTPEHDLFLQLIRAFDRKEGKPVAKLGDVYLMKLLCETIFRDAIVPAVMQRKAQEQETRDGVVRLDEAQETNAWADTGGTLRGIA